jgi:hypothetical protein
MYSRLATPVAPIEKKLTPMEKLKLKMRAGLEKQSKLTKTSYHQENSHLISCF